MGRLLERLWLCRKTTKFDKYIKFKANHKQITVSIFGPILSLYTIVSLYTTTKFHAISYNTICMKNTIYLLKHTSLRCCMFNRMWDLLKVWNWAAPSPPSAAPPVSSYPAPPQHGPPSPAPQSNHTYTHLILHCLLNTLTLTSTTAFRAHLNNKSFNLLCENLSLLLVLPCWTWRLEIRNEMTYFEECLLLFIQ